MIAGLFFIQIQPALALTPVPSPNTLAVLDVGGNVSRIVTSGNYAYVALSGVGLARNFVIVDISIPSSPRVVGGLSVGTISSLAVSGTTVYLAGNAAASGHLTVVDVSNPANPRVVGQASIADIGVNVGQLYSYIAVIGTHAYFVYSTPTLTLKLAAFDVSNPASPRNIAALDLGSLRVGRAIAASGNRVYFVALRGGISELLVIDVSSPASPVLLTRFGSGFNGQVSSLALAGQTLYIGVGSGTRVYLVDVSNPLAPAFVGSGINVGGEVIDVAVESGYAYIARSALNFDFSPGGQNFYIYDVSNAASPAEVGGVNVAGGAKPTAFRLANSYGFMGLADAPFGNFRVLDLFGLSPPPPPTPTLTVSASPSIITEGRGESSTLTWSSTATSCTASGGWSGARSPSGSETVSPRETTIYTLTCTNQSGAILRGAFVRVDAEVGPGVITRVASLDVGGTATAMAADGRYVYLGSPGYPSGVLVVVDVSNPAAPRVAGRVGGVTLGLGFAGNPHHVMFASNERVFMLNPTADASVPENLTIVDASNPLSPRIVKRMIVAGTLPFVSYDLPHILVSRVVASQTYLYVSLTNGKLVIYDIADPATPRVVTTMTPPGETLALSDRSLYVRSSNGFSVMDLVVPTAPRVVGSISDSRIGVVSAFAASGNTVVFSGSRAAFVADVANPAAPRIQSVINVDNVGASVAAVAGESAILALPPQLLVSGLTNLRLFDVSNPASPIPVGAGNLEGIGGIFTGLGLSGRYAFVGVGGGSHPGFFVFSLPIADGVPPPTLTLSASPPSITSGQSSTLSWSSTNATTCTASGGLWTGVRATSGTDSVSPGATTTYTLTCTGAGGSASQSVTVAVVLICVAACAAPPVGCRYEGGDGCTSCGALVCPPPPTVRGDLTGDGLVTLADLRQQIRMLIGSVPVDLAKADLTGDGTLTLADLRALVGILVGGGG